MNNDAAAVHHYPNNYFTNWGNKNKIGIIILSFYEVYPI